MFEVKNLINIQASEWNCGEDFFPQVSASWCDQLNE